MDIANSYQLKAETCVTFVTFLTVTDCLLFTVNSVSDFNIIWLVNTNYTNNRYTKTLFRLL